MKLLQTLIFSLLFCNGYAQRYTCDHVDNYDLGEIYSELTTVTGYSIEDSKCLGEKMAKRDSTNGIKQILTYDGPFRTGCLVCLYHEFGFKTYNFGPDDFMDEHVDAFVEAYNSKMESMLTNEQRKKIEDIDVNPQEIFGQNLIEMIQFDIKITNGSNLNVKLFSDKLEDLFKTDIDFIIVSISDSLRDPAPQKFSYSELKTYGFELEVEPWSEVRLHLSFDLSLLSNNYDICWCEILEQKYRIVLPLKIH